MTNYITCETTAAIVVHIREIGPDEFAMYSGHEDEKESLCGARVAWDTNIPVGGATCTRCNSAKRVLGKQKC